MSTYEIVACESRCDLCGSVSVPFFRAVTCDGTKPDGWEEVDGICYSSDHYYKDGYPCKNLACPDCVKKKEKGKTPHE